MKLFLISGRAKAGKTHVGRALFEKLHFDYQETSLLIGQADYLKDVFFSLFPELSSQPKEVYRPHLVKFGQDMRIICPWVWSRKVVRPEGLFLNNDRPVNLIVPDIRFFSEPYYFVKRLYEAGVELQVYLIRLRINQETQERRMGTSDFCRYLGDMNFDPSETQMDVLEDRLKVYVEQLIFDNDGESKPELDSMINTIIQSRWISNIPKFINDCLGLAKMLGPEPAEKYEMPLV